MRKIELNKEQIEYLIKNYPVKTNKELVEEMKLSMKVIDRHVKELNLFKYKEDFFSEEIKNKIIKKYPFTKNEELAKELDININTMKNFAYSNKLKKNKNFHNFRNSNNGLTTQQKEYIIDNYSTMRTNEICRKLNINYKKVNDYAVYMNLKKEDNYNYGLKDRHNLLVEKRTNNNYNLYDYINKIKEPKIDEKDLYTSIHGKYYVNKDYFKIINNEWKAYWLGFLYADGCVSPKNNVISLGLKLGDIKHLEKFKNSLQSDYNIKTRSTFLNEKEFFKAETYICNKEMVEDLTKLGCVPNKSLILKFPTEKEVPNELIRHFIRGYFDGDGWIYYNKEIKSIGVGFIGTPNMMNGIKKYLIKELNVSDNLLKNNHGKIHTVSAEWGSFMDCERIYNHLYNNSNICLDRKLEKFDKILCLN